MTEDKKKKQYNRLPTAASKEAELAAKLPEATARKNETEQRLANEAASRAASRQQNTQSLSSWRTQKQTNEETKPKQTKWYKGSTPTEIETLAQIVKIGEQDETKGRELFGYYEQAKQEGHWAETYDKATSRYAAALGLPEGTTINDEFFEQMKPYFAAGVTTDAGNLSTAKKNGADALFAANLAGLYDDYQKTKTLKAESDNMFKEIQYWVGQGLTDDEIRKKVDIEANGAYGNLRKAMAKTVTGEYEPTTEAIPALTSYGVDGMIWAARNPGKSTGDYKLDAVQGAMGRGVQHTSTPEEIARRTPGSDSWAPYASGTTMHDEAILLGTGPNVSPEWFEQNRSRILATGTEEEQKAFASMWAAEQRTQKVEQQMADLTADIEKRLNDVSLYDSEEDFIKKVFGTADEPVYDALAALDDSMLSGKVVGLTRGVGYDRKTLEAEARKSYSVAKANADASRSPEALDTAVENEKQALVRKNGTLYDPSTTPQSQTNQVVSVFDEAPEDVLSEGFMWASTTVPRNKPSDKPLVSDENRRFHDNMAGKYAGWTDEQKEIAQDYLYAAEKGYGTSEYTAAMKEAGMTDDQINAFRAEASEAMATGGYNGDEAYKWFEEAEPAEETVDQQAVLWQAIGDGDYLTAAEIQYHNLSGLMAESDDPYVNELIHSQGSQKAAAALMSLVVEGRLPEQIGDPKVKQELQTFEKYALRALGVDKGILDMIVYGADRLLNMDGQLIAAQENDGLGLTMTLNIAWEQAMNKGMKLVDNVIGEALVIAGSAFGAESLVAQGKKIASSTDSATSYFDQLLADKGTPLEIIAGKYGGEAIHMQQLSGIASGLMGFAAVKFSGASKFITRMIGSLPFAVEVGAADFHETYNETNDVIVSAGTSLAAAGVTALMSNWDGVLKNIEAQGLPYIPEVVEKLSVSPGSGALAGVARWGKSFTLWLGNLCKTAVNEALQEPAENMATTFLTDLIKGDNPFDKDWAKYGKELKAEAVGAAILSLGSTASTFSAYTRSAKVVEAQMNQSELTPADVETFVSAMKEDVKDPQIVAEMKERADNIAVETRTGELVSEGALAPVDTSASTKAKKSVDEAQKALDKTTAKRDAAAAETLAAHKAFNENPSDANKTRFSAALKAEQAANEQYDEAVTKTQTAQAELETAQASEQAQSEAVIGAARAQAQAEVQASIEEVTAKRAEPAIASEEIVAPAETTGETVLSADSTAVGDATPISDTEDDVKAHKAAELGVKWSDANGFVDLVDVVTRKLPEAKTLLNKYRHETDPAKLDEYRRQLAAMAEPYIPSDLKSAYDEFWAIHRNEKNGSWEDAREKLVTMFDKYSTKNYPLPKPVVSESEPAAPSPTEQVIEYIDDVVAQEVEKYKEELDKGNEEFREKYLQKREELAKRGRYRNQIRKGVADLVRMVEKPTGKKHVLAGLDTMVVDFLKELDLGTRGKKAVALGEKIRNVAATFAENNANPDAGIVIDPDIIESMSILAKETAALDSFGKLTTEQMRDLRDMVASVKHIVKNADKMFTSKRNARISDVGARSVQQISQKADYKAKDGMRKKMKDLLSVGMLDSFHFFDTLGSASKEVFNGVREGLNKKTKNIQTAVQYVRDTVSGADKALFLGDKAPKTEYKTESGATIELTKPQVMELYCLNKRDDAKRHLLYGGIRTSDNVAGVKLAESDIDAITSSLSESEREIADKLQQFMSTQCSEWGNETSMTMSGYRKFRDKNYYPMKVDENTVKTSQDLGNKTNDLYAVMNKGFTKDLRHGAVNQLLIGDIFDTFSQYVDDVTTYNAYAAPVYDMIRWFNYKPSDGVGLKTVLEQKIGTVGRDYIPTLIRDLNGSTGHSYSPGIAEDMTRRAKSASIGANIRVAIQQPTAIARAAMVMNPKYIVAGAKATPKALNEAVELATMYCPIAAWKSMGFYETNIGNSLQELMFPERKSLKDKATEAGMWLTGKMDELTFGALWRACEKEVTDGDSSLTGKELYQAVGKRLSEVIDYTQVVDTPLHRTQLMRSKNTGVQMATSFMTEPAKTYNMLQGAIAQAKANPDSVPAKKQVSRALAVYTTTALLNAVAQSLWDGVRDDEDDEYLEKVGHALVGNYEDAETIGDYAKIFMESNVGSSLNPLNTIPFVKDIISMMQGYEPTRLDLQAVSKVVKLVKQVPKVFNGESEWNAYQWIRSTASAFSYATGVPADNFIRDSVAVYNTVAGMFGGEKIVARTQPVGITEQAEHIYDAIVSGDKEAFDKWVKAAKSGEKPKNDNDIDLKVAEILANEDDRIAEAGAYRNAGRATEVNRIGGEVVADLANSGVISVERAVEIVDKAIKNYAPKQETKFDPDKQLNAELYASKDVVSAVFAMAGANENDVTPEDIQLMISELTADSSAKDPAKQVATNIRSAAKDMYAEYINSGADKEAIEDLDGVLMAILSINYPTLEKWKEYAESLADE